MIKTIVVLAALVCVTRQTSAFEYNPEAVIEQLEHIKHVEFSFPQLCSRYVKLIAYEFGEEKYFQLDPTSAKRQLSNVISMLNRRPNMEEWVVILDKCTQLDSFEVIDENKDDILSKLTAQNHKFDNKPELNALIQDLEDLGNEYLDFFFAEEPSQRLCFEYVRMLKSMRTSSPRGSIRQVENGQLLIQDALNSLARVDESKAAFAKKDLDSCMKFKNFEVDTHHEMLKQRQTIVAWLRQNKG